MAHIQACPRIPVERIKESIPTKWFEAMEHNQQIKTCCRSPQNHDIEAHYTCEEEQAKGAPDLYIFHCKTCGCRHIRLMSEGRNGGSNLRIIWR